MNHSPPRVSWVSVVVSEFRSRKTRMPIDPPSEVGFRMTGRPSSSTQARAASPGSSWPCSGMCGRTVTPPARIRVYEVGLCIAIALASTPEPV
ncbi:hypothetical protein GCM10010430_74430 [Kitasatospora cystarginea]|uniref:Uncharacterized protein n=1 Tax=Kitasatospora cystarginea TaxID=58350 RepID=A0ABP5RVL5_9ACTN